MSGIANACLSCLSTVDRWCHITACLGPIGGRPRDIYEATLADNEREAVSDLLGYLENVCSLFCVSFPFVCDLLLLAPYSYGVRRGGWALSSPAANIVHFLVQQRGETDFFSGEPLRSLSTLVYSDNVDLQRSASLTFAEITERGRCAT